jgi:ribonucleoside-diphosphate reductase alpha chain
MESIVKRDGSVEIFNPEKIYRAIEKALAATGEDTSLAKKIGDQVIEELSKKPADFQPTVEYIQDMVENRLIANGKYDTAKAYIVYRQSRSDLRRKKEILGVRDTLKLPLNSLRILEERYLQRDTVGKIVESPTDMFRRVARAIAQIDSNYAGDVSRTEEMFYNAMARLEFLPNSPTLMNAGTALGQLSACFVLPVEDSLQSIFDALKYAAIIHQSGGGTGFSFSRIRPNGDVVKSTMGVASGPISFMKIFDRATEIIKQGGRRRGANMGVLSVHHPDIIDFIRAKENEGELANFNISVAVTDTFIKAAVNNQTHELINPRNNQVVDILNARDVFDLIVTNAWKSGDPGMIYIDEINRKNQTPELGNIETTNPCGEVPLLSYESCNLGSINLTTMFSGGEFDFTKLGKTVALGVHFLDNVIDANHYVLPDIEKVTTGNRKIGLGVMGFADCLLRLGIPYDSQESLDFAERIIRFIQDEARRASRALAEQLGSFSYIERSIFKKAGPMRNATVTSIAPTGTISTIADTSSGIEPLFSVGYLRRALDTTFLVINAAFESIAKKRGFYSHDLMSEVVHSGSIKKIKTIPEDVRRLFVTAHDIEPEFHVKMQAVFQRYVDNAVSKTINLPKDATLEQTRAVFVLANKLKCKGITIYRYGSKKTQALEFGDVNFYRTCGDSVCAF